MAHRSVWVASVGKALERWQTANCGVYCITSPSGKKYIGSSNNIIRRWKNHKTDLRKGKHHSPYLQNAWNKYQGNLEFYVLLLCQEQDLQLYEQQYLDFYKPEYNISPTAYSCRGIKRSQEFKDKLKQFMTGNTIMNGRKLSEETKKKVSQSLQGNKRACGQHQTPRTESHKKNLSLAGIGHIVSLETRKKISEAFRLKREAKYGCSL